MTFYDKVKIDQSGDKVQVTFYDKVKNSSIRGEKFRWSFMIKLEMINQGIKFMWPFIIKLEMINLGKKVQVMFYDKVRNDKSGEKSSGDLLWSS